MRTITDVLDDHMINYRWVNDDNLTYDCPFCGKGDGHFTISVTKGLFNCYSGKCGMSGNFDMLFPGELDNRINSILSFTLRKEEQRRGLEVVEIKMPKRAALTQRVVDYLERRGLPEEIIDDWDLYLTKEFPYRNRVILPVKVEGVNVGFQARSLFSKQRPKYRSPKGVNLRSYLFGIDKVKRGDRIILVEGPFDAIKLQTSGFPAVGIFGKKMTRNQMELLKTKKPKRVDIMLDSDVIMMDAITLLDELSPHFDTKVALLDYGDPAELTREAMWYYLEAATNDVFQLRRRKLNAKLKKLDKG